MSEESNINITHSSEFKKIFDGHYAPLCLFAERYLDNFEDAADTVQEAFIKLWHRRKDFFNLYAIKSFLYTTVRNASLNKLAHLKVEEKYKEWFVTIESEDFFHDHVIEQEFFRILWEAIQALPEQTRKVMLLAWDGKDNRTIAATLGIAEGTVHTHKKIGYRRLRESLQDHLLLLLNVLLLTAGKY